MNTVQRVSDLGVCRRIDLHGLHAAMRLGLILTLIVC